MQTVWNYDLGDRPLCRVEFMAAPSYPATEPSVLATPTTRTATLTDPNGTVTDLGAGSVVATGVIEWDCGTLATAGPWTLKIRGTATVIAGYPLIRLNVNP